MASNNIARLGVVLGLDSGEFQKGVDAAIAANVKLKRQIEKDVKNAAADIEKLKYATEDYGKSVSQVERIQREMIAGGRYANATQDLKNKLLEQAAAYDKKVAAENKAYISGSKLFQMTTQQRAALAYQTTDIITGLASGQNPMIVLIQQGGQLRDQFGGFIPLFKGVAQMFSLTRIAVGGLATAFAALGIAAYKSAEEVDALNKSLVLTNNYAGMSLDRLMAMSEEIGTRFKISVSSARDILTSLVSSGKFTGDTLDSVANVIARVSKLSGESAEKVAKELMPSFNGTAASARNLNERFNFLNLAQYRQIELLESQGRLQEAAKLTADLLTESLNKQVGPTNLLASAFSDLKRNISDATQAFMDMFQTETNVQKMQRLAREAEELNAKFGGDKDKMTEEQRRKVGGAIQLYLGQLRIVQREQEKLLEESEAKRKEKEKINLAADKSSLQLRLQLQTEYEKTVNDRKFQEAMFGASELERITIESNKKAADAVAEYNLKNQQEQNQNKLIRAKILAAQIEAINLEAAQKRQKISDDEARTINEEQESRLTAVKLEEEKLQLYRDNIFLSQSQLDLAISRLRTEEEILKILRNEKLEEKDKLAAIAKAREIQERREGIIAMSEDLKILQDVNKSVFSNMEQALDNFVRTGKLSFKDLARSIIQDILAIYMKAQMLQMFNLGKGFFGNMFGGGFGTGSAYGNVDYGMFFADGGDPPVNRPAIVGERGPELFIPRTAGTIIPNDKLGSAMGGNNYITNNYIDAIDTKSFEERLLGSSNAIWAANQYANKSLAVGRGRA